MKLFINESIEEGKKEEMKYWNDFFPDEKQIIVWGIGEYGISWVRFLQKMEKRIIIFDGFKQGKTIIDDVQSKNRMPLMNQKPISV